MHLTLLQVSLVVPSLTNQLAATDFTPVAVVYGAYTSNGKFLASFSMPH